MIEVKKHYKTRQLQEHYWIINKNGQRTCEYKEWYENGQIKAHYQEYEHKKWHNNGQLWEHCIFKDESEDGEYKMWYKNGQIRNHFFIENKALHGESKEWDINGQLTEHCFYQNNKIVDISEYITDINNIVVEEYFHLQLVFGYFPIIKFDS